MRLKRINEYRRQKILEKHKTLREKNDQKKFRTNLMQNCAINKAIADKEAKKTTFNFLSKLMKADPYKKTQRTRLISALSTLSLQFDLGMDSARAKVRGSVDESAKC